jgi:hypothetical protein
MPSDNSKSEYLNNKKPAIYRIRVQGELDESWSGRLQGMQITIVRKNQENPVTILKGKLKDQAALSGVLNTLYELHVAVLSVEYIKS